MSGGAWKVAYADFVTAMMALFMVLWISSQDEEIVLKTVEYFKNPIGVGFNESKTGKLSTKDGEGGEKFTLKQQSMPKTSVLDLAFLQKLASDYYKRMKMDKEERGDDESMKVDVTPDGLRITLFDNNAHPFFERGKADLTEWGMHAVQNIAWLIDRNPMRIRIDTHVPKNYAIEKEGKSKYDEWDLTVDRANVVRQQLQHYSLMPEKIMQVSGYGSSVPLAGRDAYFFKNDRVEISMVVE